MDAPTAPDPEIVASVLAAVAAKDVRLVDLQFSDITGGGKALTIPAELLESTFTVGYRFDGSALTGGLREVELDLYLVPDPRTLAIYPRTSGDGQRARLCCSVRRRNGQPFAGDPRSLLERSLAQAADAGYRYKIGIEMEFYLLPRNDGQPAPPIDAAGYFGIGEDLIASTRDEILTVLQRMGIGAGAHHETGPGQEELDLPVTDALRMADQLITVRQVIRSIANRKGLRATFMPKPMADAPGSGMHVFQSLFHLDGTDALRNAVDDLSQVAYWAIGGQLAHATGMCAVVCPSVNSYKRLNAGHRAPRHATWARVSQASLIRVPSWADGGNAEIELRSPDAISNPYLVFATALSCAMDGIHNQIEPPEPLDENYTSYNDEEMLRRGVTRLPGTLGEALTAYLDDQVVQTTIGSYISSQLIKLKRDEWETYRSHVSPWEFNRYVDA
jgi:glutamine synthetase